MNLPAKSGNKKTTHINKRHKLKAIISKSVKKFKILIMNLIKRK